MKNKKHFALTIVGLVILFLIGLAIYIYPFVADRWNAHRNMLLIENYEQVVIDNGPEERYKKMFKKAEAYNQALSEQTDRIMFHGKKDKEYESILNLGGDGIMGYIEIPKIQINIPIYHYTSDDVLEKGIGHIQGSSLPIGGKTTRCILTGHRGLPESKLFTDLDKVETGDMFYIHVLDHNLAYKVFNITTVLPYEIDRLIFRKDKDLVTLVTCTPYGVNTHRMLVTGRRVKFDPEIKEQEEKTGQELEIKSKFTPQNGLVAGLIVFMTILLISIFISRHRRKKS